MYIFERIDAIRFERKFDDSTKVWFTIEDPKTIGISNATSIINVGQHDIHNIGGVFHEWQSVFHHHTKIILVGKIKEEKIHRAIAEYHEGEFDFEELCKGNLVKI